MILSTDSEERKNTPLYSGCIAYFALALAAVARHSKRGNDKHNPGQPLHWAREKSTDHLDCIARHIVDANEYNEELKEYEEAAALAWRALANLQILEEKRLGKGPQPGQKLVDSAASVKSVAPFTPEWYFKQLDLGKGVKYCDCVYRRDNSGQWTVDGDPVTAGNKALSFCLPPSEYLVVD